VEEIRLTAIPLLNNVSNAISIVNAQEILLIVIIILALIAFLIIIVLSEKSVMGLVAFQAVEVI
jgi:hypothetical protein